MILKIKVSINQLSDLSLSSLSKIFSGRYLEMCFLFFPQKTSSNGIFMNVKACIFLRMGMGGDGGWGGGVKERK